MLSKKSPMKALIRLIRPFYSYILIGMVNTLMCCTLMYLGSRMGLNYLGYTAFGYIFSILFSFFMNLRYTFRVQGNTFKKLVLFLCVNLTNLFIVELIEHSLIETYKINPVIAILAGITWYTTCGFLFSVFWIFRNATRIPPHG